MSVRGAMAVGLAFAAASACLAAPAWAVDRRAEAGAKDALKKAANDYLSTDYTAGAARLQKAVKACGASKCTAGTRAALLRDLGTMQFRLGDLGEGQRSWAAARAAQPAIALNPDYDAPDLRAAWDDGKGGGSAQPTGDFAHSPAAEQRVNTPLPIYAEYAGGAGVARVVVKYRGSSGGDWKRVDLKRMGSGWGGLIPCGDVAKGTMRYWLQGFDDGGDPVASSGDPKRPYSVAIRDDISGEAPRLPGKPAPSACTEQPDRDCPPGLPGCEERVAAAEGEGGAAEAPEPKPSGGGGTYAHVWIGISAELPEFLRMPEGDALCKLNAAALPLNSAGYYCTNPDGTDFPSRSSPTQNSNLQDPNQAGHVDGGIHVGDVRVMGVFDYALNPSFLLGARGGYVFNAYSGQAAVTNGKAFGPKIHLEARATYLFGSEPLKHTGFAPMVFLGAGVSEFDGHATSVVTLANVAGQQPVNVWLVDGPFFAALGAGVRYQFSLRAAFTLAARANGVFGGNGFLLTYGPEVGIQYGF